MPVEAKLSAVIILFLNVASVVFELSHSLILDAITAGTHYFYHWTLEARRNARQSFRAQPTIGVRSVLNLEIGSSLIN